MSRRRALPQPFGLSVLDTVTCGLGGAIVILLYAAITVTPGAPVVTTTAQAATAAETATAPSAAESLAVQGLLTVIFEGAQADPMPCASAPASVRSRVVRTPAAVRAQPDALARRGLVLWSEDPAAVNRLCVVAPRGSDSFTFATEGIASPWTSLTHPGEGLCFMRNRTDGIFEPQNCP